jgi:transposase-like protein
VTVTGKEDSLPWKDTSPLQQRKAFIDEYLKKEHSVSELCRRFEVSRKTAYKWIDRFMAGCELVDRSRRPHSSPRAITAALEDAIVEARKQRPNSPFSSSSSTSGCSGCRAARRAVALLLGRRLMLVPGGDGRGDRSAAPTEDATRRARA